MKDLTIKKTQLIAHILLEAAIEKAHQKTLQKKIHYISDTTAKLVDSVQEQKHRIAIERISDVEKLTNSILHTIEQNLDNLSPVDVLNFMDLIHTAQSKWNLTEEETAAIIDRLNNASFPLD